MTPSTPASTLTDDQIDEAQSECDAFLCDNCDIRIHEFAREIEYLVRSTPAAVEVSEPVAWMYWHKVDSNKVAAVVKRMDSTIKGADEYVEIPLYPAEAMSARGREAFQQGYDKGYHDRACESDRHFRETGAALSTPPEAAASVQGDSDREETITANPKSWVAWKREAERLAALLATPVVQGEPSIYECSGCGTVTRDPAKHIALLKKAGHISCCPDADYRATPAPSPKVPSDKPLAEVFASAKAFLDSLDASDTTIHARDASRLESAIHEYEMVLERAALATRGPIGAVEPTIDMESLEEIMRRACVPESYRVFMRNGFMSCAAALSRTPGEEA